MASGEAHQSDAKRCWPGWLWGSWRARVQVNTMSGVWQASSHEGRGSKDEESDLRKVEELTSSSEARTPAPRPSPLVPRPFAYPSATHLQPSLYPERRMICETGDRKPEVQKPESGDRKREKGSRKPGSQEWRGTRILLRCCGRRLGSHHPVHPVHPVSI